jgi:hypothetical protein
MNGDFIEAKKGHYQILNWQRRTRSHSSQVGAAAVGINSTAE